MSWNIASFLRRLRKDESGAVMVLVAVSIVALLLLTALAFGLGTLIYAQRRLQATTDMAALSGAAAYSFNVQWFQQRRRTAPRPEIKTRSTVLTSRWRRVTRRCIA